MTAPDSGVTLDPIYEEGLDWVSRMGSGEITAEERQAFAQWRAISPRHEAAFRKAAALAHVLREASADILDEHRAGAVVPLRRRTLDRRAVMTGAIAASAAGILVVGSSGLLSRFGRRPDYSTGTGERRTLALAPGLTVDLDAQTSINVDQAGGRHRIELINGRTAVDAQLASSGGVELIARKGTVQAGAARFEVESDDDRSCVTCVSGRVTLLLAGQQVAIPPRHQVTYADEKLDPPLIIDPAAETAWTTGQLIFRHTPLEEVIRQVNRYRPGRVMIAGAGLGRRPVSGVFQIAHIDDAVLQIQQITGARILHLPGGMVVFA